MTTRNPHTEPPDGRLGEALRSLPGHRPPDGFTDRVMDRLAEAEGAPRRPRAVRPTFYRAAAAALVGAAILAGFGADRLLTEADPTPESLPRQASREGLEDERARLEAELAELRRMAAELNAESVPVLYLGGDEDVDLVLDLGRLAREAQGDPRYRFTTYEPEADRP